MLESILVPDGEQLQVDEWKLEQGTVKLAVTARQSRASCPGCDAGSARVHSRYTRTLADLACAGFQLKLCWTVRRFFCDNPACGRVTFVEQLPTVAARYARKTQRLAEQQQHIAFHVGGEVGARVMGCVHAPISPDTLLRLIRRAVEEVIETPRVLGVDDWAFRKGHNYGTLLVNLETHRAIDLLPDRTAASLAAWLQAHPGIEVIGRDRSSEYIKGINIGAPDAIQVADRWHLLKNLREALEGFLEYNRGCLQAAADAAAEVTVQPAALPSDANTPTPEPDELATDPNETRPLTKAQQLSAIRRAKRLERYEEVRALHARGLPQREIARRMGLSRKTVRRYIRAETFPEYPKRRWISRKLDPFLVYLEERWAAGCHNGARLYRELCERGYPGSRSLVADWVAQQRKELRATGSTDSNNTAASRPWAAGRAAWVLVLQDEKLSTEERAALAGMEAVNPKISLARHLALTFGDMFRARQADRLTGWLEQAAKSGIRALQTFVKGLRQDLAAVTAALSYPWSNGPVEGQINRLKFVKRSMYGRANFDLLRRRVLGRPVLV